MTGIVSAVALVIVAPALCGFQLGKRGPAWTGWLYVLGIPILIGVLGVFLMSVAPDPPARDAYFSDEQVYGFLTLLAAPFVFVSNLVGVVIGWVRNESRRRTRPIAW